MKLLLLLSTLLTINYTYAYAYVENEDFYDTRAYCPSNLDPSFQRRKEFIDFLAKIEGEKEWTLTRTLHALPNNLSMDVAIMAISGSLQGADPENPRVLFKPTLDATFFASYNTNSLHHGYNTLEFILWNHEHKNYDFIEVSYSESEESGNDTLHTPVVTINPEKCTSCHTIGSKLNWDSYNFWANQIPAVADDVIFDHEKRLIEKYLKNINNDDLNSRWSFLKRFFTEDEVDLADGIRFSDDITHLNGCKLENESFNKPKISKYIKLLVSYSIHCDSINDPNVETEDLAGFPGFDPTQILPSWAKEKHDNYFKKLFENDGFVFPDTIRKELRKLDNESLERRRSDFISLTEDLNISLTDDIISFIGGKNNYVELEVDPVDGSTDNTVFQMANVWYLLAPLGVNVDRWSTSIVPEEKTFGDFYKVGSSLAYTEYEAGPNTCNKIVEDMTDLVGSIYNIEQKKSSEVLSDIIFAYDEINHDQLDFLTLPKVELFMSTNHEDLRINQIIEKLNQQVTINSTEYELILDYFLDWKEMTLSEALVKRAL